MTGQYADILKPIAIDQNGLMLAVMKGDFSGALKTVAVDTDGIMKANLSAQDLKPLTTIPAFGTGHILSGIKGVAGGGTGSCCGDTGRGVLYGGYVQWSAASTMKECRVELWMEAGKVFAIDAETMNACNLVNPMGSPLYLSVYTENAVFEYVVQISRGVPYDSSWELKVYNSTGSLHDFNYYVSYGKV